jgi:hypothetical protein
MSSDRASPLRFVALFAIYVVSGTALMAVPWIDSNLVDPWTRLNAGASAGITDLAGFDTTSEGTLVRSGSATLQVLDGCNGAHALLILVSAILAYPAPWIAILGFNLVRLVNLILVARLWPSRLELFHIYIWQTLIVLIAFALFFTWTQLAGRTVPTVSRDDAG